MMVGHVGPTAGTVPEGLDALDALETVQFLFIYF